MDEVTRNTAALVKMIASAHLHSPVHFSTLRVVRLAEMMADPIAYTMEEFRGRRANIATSPVMAAVAIASVNVDRRRLSQFCHVLVSGMPTGPGDIAALHLREFLLRQGPVRSEEVRQETVRRTMRAIEAFMEGESIERLRAPKRLVYRLPGLNKLL